ncbi:hypothetical protein [Haliangium sp.]|uniref:hypothetical protein n=1 Tax=Haliangium sp. TaxID=2663208 RepID=UPI003D0B019A
MRLLAAAGLAGFVLVGLGSPALAKSAGPGLFCSAYPASPLCVGTQPACTLCHSVPPERNGFGAAVEAELLPGAPRPLSDADYAQALPGALAAVEGADSDGDGVSNLDEILAGTFPADPSSLPQSDGCDGGGQNPYYDLCSYDARYALKKLRLDVCGYSPSFEEVEEIAALAESEQRARLHQVLDECLDSEFWQGKNGVLWELAHAKIRPVGSLKSGEDAGQLGISDYYDDYHLFVWSQIDDHDVRDLLTADYYVERISDAPTRYQQAQDLPTQLMQRERRAGLMTTNWVMVYNVMFTALPRTAAAQAYRAFLGFDIARLEGLDPVAGEPRDYDDKGVDQPACAVCHATLDPLTYPFRNYNGFSGGQPFRYVDGRIEAFFANEAPTITDIPEAGVVLGQPVADLVEWAQVAADSSEFLIATVRDYWRLLVGGAPAPTDEEFQGLWQRLGDEHAYSVERMLHELIDTEAYGVP